MIFAPPQHGKSEHSSRMLPAFILGRNNQAKILCVSYGISLATEFNRDVQNIMDSNEYRQVFPDSRLGGENVRTLSGKARRNADLFDVVTGCGDLTGGMYVCAGKDGSVTGKGFDFILVDDLIKTRAEADSVIERDATYRAYEGTIRARRRSHETGILLLNTRWHPDDVSGRLQRLADEKPESDQWVVLSLPAIAEESDAFREPGEALWPERFPISDLLSTRASLTPYEWASQYQQHPVAREGNIIKREWFEPTLFAIDLAEIAETCIYFDLGASDQPTADETAGSVKAKMNDGSTVTLWQLAGRWLPHDRNRQILEFGKQWNTEFPGLPIYLEAGIGLGAAGIEELRDALLAAGLNAQLDHVRESKVTRASAQKDSYLAAAQAAKCKLYGGDAFEHLGFVDGQHAWINGYLDSVAQLQFKQTARGVEFTGGHDDRLDCEVGSHNKLASSVKVWFSV